MIRASEVNGNERAALTWLAQAIPAPVEIGFFEDEEEHTAARYELDFDQIKTKSPAEIEAHGMEFLEVLIHEGVHSTQFHVGRTPPLSVLHYMLTMPGFAPMWHSIEEAIAYRGTYLLGKALGFEWQQSATRLNMTLAGAPPQVYAEVERRAREAAEWLLRRGDTTAQRPFGDMLAAMVYGAE